MAASIATIPSKVGDTVQSSPAVQHISLEYIGDLDLYKTTKPYYVGCAAKEVPEDERTNIETVWVHDVPVHDVRGVEHTLSFEKEGFKFYVQETSLGVVFSEAEVNTEVKSLADLLRRDIRAEKAVCYDMRVSRAANIINAQSTR